MLQSSEEKGLCYVETKNLDGETNLKHKLVEKAVNKLVQENAKDYAKVKGSTLICEAPNTLIYKFEGSFDTLGKKISLGSENIVLRGSSLKNTEFIVGFVVYNGH